MALSVLRGAIARHPERHDLRTHLQRLESQGTNSDPRPAESVEVPSAIVAMHLVVAWLMLIAPLFAAAAVPAYAVRLLPAFPSLSVQGASGLTLAVGIALAIAWGFVAAVFAVKVFCRLWFAYLRRLPEPHALAADARLPSVVTTWQMGRTYLQARQAFFAKRYGSPASVSTHNA